MEEDIDQYRKQMVEKERTIQELTKIKEECRNQQHLKYITDLQQHLAFEKKKVDTLHQQLALGKKIADELRQHRDNLQKDKEHLLTR
jgi:uncharacterized protein with ATP-grasp and redox domains